MRQFQGHGIGRRVRKVGSNAFAFLLALAVPPQATNAVLYLTGDIISPEVGVWRRIRLMISNHVSISRRTKSSSNRS
jgi:hypothetical protein